MRVKVDRKADAITLFPGDAVVEESAETSRWYRRIVGIKVLDASKCTGDPSPLVEMKFEALEEA